MSILKNEFALLLNQYAEKMSVISQINPKKLIYNTAFSVQLPYIAGHSFKLTFNDLFFPLINFIFFSYFI